MDVVLRNGIKVSNWNDLSNEERINLKQEANDQYTFALSEARYILKTKYKEQLHLKIHTLKAKDIINFVRILINKKFANKDNFTILVEFLKQEYPEEVLNSSTPLPFITRNRLTRRDRYQRGYGDKRNLDKKYRYAGRLLNANFGYKDAHKKKQEEIHHLMVERLLEREIVIEGKHKVRILNTFCNLFEM